MTLLKTLTLAAAFAASLAEASEFQPAPVFTDNMVLQRHEPIRLWGVGEPGTTLVATLNGASRKTRVDREGRWDLKFKSMPAGGPFELKFQVAGETHSLRNVLVGDLWLCSGQSNMAWPVAKSTGAKPWAEGIPRDIRLFSVAQDYAVAPQSAFSNPTAWQVAEAQTLPEFSSVCSYFAERVHDALQVPLGLIHSSWGGSQIEAWIAADALAAIDGLQADLELLQDYVDAPQQAMREYGEQWQTWWQQNTKPWQNPAEVTFQPVPKFASWRTWDDPEFNAFNGLLWYSKRFELSESQAVQDGTLELGGIDEVDLTWINGEIVGTQFGWGTPRTYLVPASALQAGINQLVVNVQSTYGDGGMVGPEAQLNLTLANGQRIALAGGWQYSRVPASYGYPRNAPWQSINGLSGLYNAMIAPLKGLPIKGVLWYQGESNTGRPAQYEELMKTLIRSWRDDFGKDSPFVLVQLPGYGDTAPNAAVESGWAGVRAAQWRAVRDDANAGLAIAIDAGDPQDIHPTDKTLVGRRAADVALALSGDRAGITDGIAPARVRSAGDNWTLTFEPAEEGLRVKGGSLSYFELCAATCQRVQAQLADGAVQIAKAQLPGASKIRYCWADAPACRLVGESGLPVSSFEIELPAD